MSLASSQVVQTAPVTLTATVGGNRFVEADGTLPASGGAAFGILERNSGGVSGDVKAAVISGYAAVLVWDDAAIAKGANVSTTLLGKAKTAVSGEEILGQAVEAADAETYIMVQFDKAGILV